MDFIYGSIIGISQTIVGHPLDTIKTRIQNNSSYKIPIKHYLNGVKYPIACSILCNGLVFPLHQHLSDDLNHFQAGAITGAVATPIIYITDTFKIQKQMYQPTQYIHNGIITTAIRESIAMSLYFGVYHYLRKDGMVCFHAGGLAGVLSWLCTFPIDTIRNRQIAYKTGIMHACRLGPLWSGLSFCLARAYIVNGASFILYDHFFE